MRVDDQEVEALRLDRFVLHCPVVALRRRNSGRIAYVGSGDIRQDEHGSLMLSMYSKTRLDDCLGMVRAPIGELLSDHFYYDMEARDTKGRSWEAAHLVPRFTTTSTLSRSLLRCDLHRIEAVEDFTWYEQHSREHVQRLTHTNAVQVYSFGSYRLPANTSTETTVTFGEHWTRRRERNAATFLACGMKFTVRHDRDTLMAGASTDDALPVGLADAILDALAFVMGRAVEPSVVSVRERGVETTWVYSRRQARGEVLEPIPTNVVGCEAASWDLFDRYLSFISKPFGMDRHPLAAQWRSIQNAGAGTVEAQALTWSTATEALLRLGSFIEPFGGEERATIDEWVALVSEMLDQRDCPEALHGRIKGALGRLHERNAASALRMLEEAGTIEPAHLAAWKRIRHRTAHGSLSLDDPEALLRDITAILGLLYRLTFAMIGYEGMYRDYARTHWPARRLAHNA